MMDVSLSKADKDFDIEGGRLRFLQPNYGLFECFATNSHGSSYTGIQLTKHKAAAAAGGADNTAGGGLQLLQGPADLVVPENSNIRFTCQVAAAATGRPVAFSWSFNTKAVRPEWRVERVSDSQENLVVDRVTAEDVGTVGCLVSADAVRLYQEGSIALREAAADAAAADGDDPGNQREMSAARIVSNFSNSTTDGPLRILDGDRLSLICEAEGVPAPTVTWGGGAAVETSSSAVLTLSGLDKSRDDGARHTCRAANEAGTDERSLTLAVYERSQISDDKTDDEQPESGSLYAVRGTELVLACAFHTDPRWAAAEVQVLWEKDGGDLAEGRFRLEASVGSSILHVANLTEGDGGEYTCRIVTPLDAASRRWTIEVVTPAAIGRFESEARKLVLAGTMAELTCEAVGWPPPTVTWYLNGTQLTNGGGGGDSGGGGSLRLDEVAAGAHAGQYRCEARNTFGSEAREVELAVARPTTPITGKESSY
jgi:hypothetical protein